MPRLLALTVLCCAALAQEEDDQIYRIGGDVKPPRLIGKTDPEMTSEARAAQVQGTVLFSIVIDKAGRPTDVTLISPLGFGLDEAARKSIETWRFEPAQKSGRPVKVHANVEVNFRFAEGRFDDKRERLRTAHNAALRDLSSADASRAKKAIETIQDLSRQKYPPSSFVYASMLREGAQLQKDEEQARQLLLFAADKNFGPAVYEVGLMYLKGEGLSKDEAKGLQMIKDASVLGSGAAQQRLGAMSESGAGMPLDLAAARRYYRLCAAGGRSLCQLRLAALLLSDSARPERDYIQALAWLELAAASGEVTAKRLLEQETPKLTPEQASRVKELRPKLLRKGN
jgi:TonB family protein